MPYFRWHSLGREAHSIAAAISWIMTRRSFVAAASLIPATALAPRASAAPAPGRFRVSLAEWSVHKAIRQNKLTNLDFRSLARELGCDGVEFVNTLWGSPTAVISHG